MDIDSEVGEGFNDFDVVTGNWHKGAWEEGSVAYVYRKAPPPIHAILHEEDCKLFVRIRIRIYICNSLFTVLVRLWCGLGGVVSQIQIQVR